LLRATAQVGIFSLLVMLPALQARGWGRRTFIIAALVIATAQWLGMAALRCERWQRLHRCHLCGSR
jgi:hypothetical protein